MVATNVSTVGNSRYSRIAQNSKSVALGQQYRSIVDNFLTNDFPVLGKQDNASFYVMATMWLESGFRILHKGRDGLTTPNHVIINKNSGIGAAYWYDPIIRAAEKNANGDPTILANLTEGLRAQALMATMGMYQVRGTKESNSMLIGNYLSKAESMGLMVSPGQSPSSVFVTSDDLGARRSIFFGCLILERKLKAFLPKNSAGLAMAYALGAYLGKAGAADILGTTPEKRVADIRDPNGASNKMLVAIGYSVPNQSNMVLSPGQGPAGQSESKTAVANNTIGTLPDKVFCVT